MKIKLLIIALFAAISAIACNQTLIKIDVPKAVKDAFAAKYPTAQKVEWEMEEEGEYEAEFKLSGKEMSANFKADGTWIETETAIKSKDLPQAVKDAISSEFPDYEIEEAEQLERPDLAMGYEVELENEETDEEMSVVFTADGKVLEKKMSEDDDDNDDGGDKE